MREIKKYFYPEILFIFLLLLIILLSDVVQAEGKAQAAGKIGQGLYQTTYYLIKGEGDGPTVLIAGGIHGDETAGWQTAESLLYSSIDRGRMMIIPRANQQAVELASRSYIDGEDLNRCFPGKVQGTPMERLAKEIFELLKRKQVKVVIDLHESQTYYQRDNEYLGQTIIAYPNDQSVWVGMLVIEELNQKIAKGVEKFILLTGPVRGSLNQATGKGLATLSLTIETSMELNLTERIAYQLAAVRLILAKEGIILKNKE